MELDIDPNELKWHIRFLLLAELVASWSKDPSTKCGAAIVRPNRTILSTGFNGFPQGCDDDSVIYANREEKYARVVHAETNAILFSSHRPDGCTIYTWPSGYGPSCDRCSTNIIQSGIKRVVHVYDDKAEMNDRWKESCERGLTLYKQAGIEVLGIPYEVFLELS